MEIQRIRPSRSLIRGTYTITEDKLHEESELQPFFKPAALVKDQASDRKAKELAQVFKATALLLLSDNGFLLRNQYLQHLHEGTPRLLVQDALEKCSMQAVPSLPRAQ